MARIPEEEIERLKRDVSIVELVEASGVKLKGSGDNLVGRCPLPGHEDSTPSLVVSPSKALWHCMGKCQTGGSVIDWVMKTSGVSFRAAVEMLREKSPALGMRMPATRAKIETLAEPNAGGSILLGRVVSFYHDTAKQSPELIAYVEKRGLRSREMIERFRLGYANRTLAYRLPSKVIKAGESIRTQLQQLGVLRKSGHEHFTGSLVIPIFSEDGEVLEMYGRRISNDIRRGAPTHLYLPRRADGRRGVFNLAGLKGTKELLLCEALIDALTFWCAGHRNVTSAYGVEGFTAEMREAILEHGITRVLIAYDRDEAGDRAAAKLAGELAKDGLEVFRVLFPKGMDANEYALKVQPASKSLATAIEGAQWMAGKRPVAVLADLAPEVSIPSEAEARAIGGNKLSDGTGCVSADEIASDDLSKVTDSQSTRENLAKANASDNDDLSDGTGCTSSESIAADDLSDGTVDQSAGENLDGDAQTEMSERPGGNDVPKTIACASEDILSKRTGTEAAPTSEISGTGVSLSIGTGVVETEIAPSPEPTHETAEHNAAAAAIAPSEASSLAAVAPPASSSAAKADAEISDDEVRTRLGDRRWRIRGLAKTSTYATLRLNVLVSRGDSFFVDTLELYNARHRAAFIGQAAAELSVDESIIKSDIGKIVLRLEGLIEERLAQTLNAKPAFTMSDEQRAEALAFLRDPRLLERILEDFDRAGVVGEETNKLIGYVATISRKLEAPLAVVIQSSTAAGKSSLMDAVLRFVPEEERVQYSAMTGQSLFYMGETDLSHKILAIAEEQGVQSAAYALKLLQSEGELTIASTGKDPVTGKLMTQEYRVEGPVMIFLTTTAIEVDEELLNRCLILTVDEGARQTSAIHERQRESQTLEGLLKSRDREHLIALHQNAQRLLDPLLVANPFAKELRFSSSATRARRDHMKYLTLIRSIALLHQHQREVKTVTHRGQLLRYIEVTREDIAVADKLMASMLGRDTDEMPPQTRRLLDQIAYFVDARAKADGVDRSAVRFTRRQIREHVRLSHTQMRIHMLRLEELEYLVAHAAGAKRRVVYELMYDRSFEGGERDLKGDGRAFEGGSPLQKISKHSADKTGFEGLEGAFAKSRIGSPEKKPSYAKNGEARP